MNIVIVFKVSTRKASMKETTNSLNSNFLARSDVILSSLLYETCRLSWRSYTWEAKV